MNETKPCGAFQKYHAHAQKVSKKAPRRQEPERERRESSVAAIIAIRYLSRTCLLVS